MIKKDDKHYTPLWSRLAVQSGCAHVESWRGCYAHLFQQDFQEFMCVYVFVL